MKVRVTGLMLGTLALVGCHRADGTNVSFPATDAQRLAHTLGIVRTSTPEHPKTLKLLFYGQSITSTKWTDPAVAALKARFPDVRFIVRNMAIGGFGAVLLERTVQRDVDEFYPDLIVFHVYGDHRAYERIIRTMRQRTAAEIIVQTDHVVEPIEPMCPEGIHLTLTPPPGCKGLIRYKQHSWEQFMSGYAVPDIAKRYGLVVDPRRTAWNAVLKARGWAPATLLADPPHPNAAGWALMARLFVRFFEREVAGWHGERQALVRSLPAPAADGTSFAFLGNRIELVGAGPLEGRVSVLVDGHPPRDLDGCWQTTRATPHAGATDWPAIRQVAVDPAFHRAETWTATLRDLNPAQTDWRFSLVGARTGPDGSGTGGQDFTSPSGRVRISAQDWVLPDAVAKLGKRVPEGFQVRFGRRFVCRDEAPVPLTQYRVEQRFVVATGLPNGAHRVQLHFGAGARALVREIRTFRPPLPD